MLGVRLLRHVLPADLDEGAGYADQVLRELQCARSRAKGAAAVRYFDDLLAEVRAQKGAFARSRRALANVLRHPSRLILRSLMRS